MASYKLELLEFSNKLLILRIDGQEFKVPIEMASNRLSAETDLKRACYKIYPSGNGIHWPLIDEDLSIDSLIKMLDNK